MDKDTSWNKVAKWYDGMLQAEGTYQKDLILPNLLRLMDIHRGEAVLDLACGQGFFAEEFARAGAHVIGVDASRELIAIARKNATDAAQGGKRGVGASQGAAPDFHVARADALPFIKKGSVDKIAIILALQNIENAAAVLRECARVMKQDGKGYLVLNHPAFRIPKESSWGWDEAAQVQYRRVDRYLSELKVPIDMHPGKSAAAGGSAGARSRVAETTLSFHRPLQFYFKALGKAGFAVTGLEEWNSHKKSEAGPRAAAEDRARKEIPLFLCLTFSA